jgi:hypothetical protein
MQFFKNTKKQGDMGLGMAICYFTSIGHTVSIPLTDSQDYDLIVDNDKEIMRVQVKTCSYKRYSYEASLSVKGGNRTSKGSVKSFDPTKCDYLFIVTKSFDKYLVPTKGLNIKYNLVLGPKYQKYLLK